MKMYVHSSFGVHECIPMELQDITDVQAKDNQLSSATAEEANQISEAVQARPVEACSNGRGNENDQDLDPQETPEE